MLWMRLWVKSTLYQFHLWKQFRKPLTHLLHLYFDAENPTSLPGEVNFHKYCLNKNMVHMLGNKAPDYQNYER